MSSKVRYLDKIKICEAYVYPSKDGSDLCWTSKQFLAQHFAYLTLGPISKDLAYIIIDQMTDEQIKKTSTSIIRRGITKARQFAESNPWTTALSAGFILGSSLIFAFFF